MPILLIKPNIIDAAKQQELKEAGYVVIETDNPESITILDESPSLERDDLLNASLHALDYGNDYQARLAFGDLLRKRLKTTLQKK